MKIKVDVINRQRKLKISLKKLNTNTRKIIKILHLFGELEKFKNQVIFISVVLIGNKKMKEINLKYRGKNYVTDVLSFCYADTKLENNNIYFGEILINPQKAKFQAKKYGVSFWKEINRLLIHGIIHLLGYDHETSYSDAKKMQKIEEKILRNL